MTDQTVIAHQATGPVGFLERFYADQWPVLPEDLERTIEQAAAEQGRRVLSVGEPLRRGPLPIHDVDDNGRIVADEQGNPIVVGEIAQLYAYVEWELLAA